MLTVLAIAALLSSDPTGTVRAADISGERSITQPAPHLTPKQKAWFRHAVGDILRYRASSAPQDVDVLSPH